MVAAQFPDWCGLPAHLLSIFQGAEGECPSFSEDIDTYKMILINSSHMK